MPTSSTAWRSDNPAAGAILVVGLKEFLDDLKELPARYQRQVRGTLNSNAARIVSRAKGYAQGFAGPRAQGVAESHTSIRTTGYRTRITWTEPQAGVLEFGRDYQRRNRSAGGTHTVHMLPGVATPRFAYRAWTEMHDAFLEEVLDDLAEAAGATGFWVVS